MIVSKHHHASLLTMSIEERTEFSELCTELEGIWDSEMLTFAEHGSSFTDGSGPCISHTHVNVIPSVPEGVLALENHGLRLVDRGSLGSLPTLKDSYFLISNIHEWSLYADNHAPSQFLRQILYQHYNLVSWDWRLFPDERLVELTLNDWMKRLGVSEE
jgi:hypothetical protein